MPNGHWYATYLPLIREFPLRPLKTDTERDRACAIIDRLLSRKRWRGEDDYLDVLSTLVHAYEAKHHPVPPVPAGAMLDHLIEARDTTQTAVADATGIAASTLSAVVNGKRQLTRKQIGTLATHFAVNPSVFFETTP